MARSMRSVMRSRTMWLALALAVLGAAYDNFSYVQGLIDPQFYGVFLIVIGAAVAVLRVLTTLPLDEK